jgi:plasmid stabilization system protein ParE
LKWSLRAIHDLNRLRKFLDVSNSEAGRRAVSTIRQRSRILVDHPRIGRSVPNSDDEREWPIRFGSGDYILLYRVDDERVTILAVRHMRENGFDDGGPPEAPL